jgi:hypothetical protein
LSIKNCSLARLKKKQAVMGKRKGMEWNEKGKASRKAFKDGLFIN